MSVCCAHRSGWARGSPKREAEVQRERKSADERDLVDMKKPLKPLKSLIALFASIALPSIPAQADLTEYAQLLKPQTAEQKKGEAKERKSNHSVDDAGLSGSPPAPSPWNGVPGAHHTEDAIRVALDDPDSYQLIGTYGVWASNYNEKACWMVKIAFQAKNGFGRYVKHTGIVYETGGDTPEVLGVEID